jgi:spermidine synthase
MTRATWKVASLLFLSGACALVYQTSWLRQFRVIFGTSTYATAAVLAIFMGGLGAGSALLGRRADRSAKPLAFYGKLEIGIALSAAITPLVILVVRQAYIATGGSSSMGLFLATVVRLLLSALVLAIPTILMGGTLPAAARAVESDDDTGRKRLAFLYGANTLGAVTGTLLATFFLIEHLGNRSTLLLAAVVNVCVGVYAIITAGEVRSAEVRVAEGEGSHPAPPRSAPVTPRLAILIASFMTGFVFLLMELVWYRMLSPLLGGTTFMFGLILAVALLGVGLGGAAYSIWGAGRGTMGAFAVTCTLEALLVIAPFALGDQLALITLALRTLGSIGFGGHLVAWTLVTVVVVFPPAFVAGVQFPLLISLLGRGEEHVGRDVGAAYAWNTAGAIAGSLLGGFGLLPLLSAPGSWQLVTYLLTLLGLAGVLYAVREGQRTMAIAAGVIAVLALAGTTATGPTAPWRHSGIGAGRTKMPGTRQEARDWISRERRTLVWEADGRESTIALYAETDLSLIVNGKSDGTARADAGTQVMSGLLPMFLNPAARSVAVVGLGTGTTAGWVASVPNVERVDAIELEPMVVEAAKEYASVNRDAMKNPKVHITLGDAREILVTTRRRYDVIFSEPSNPYRAGIASLYTKEFYAAAAGRLNENGIFAQWMQTYGADADTIRTVYATLSTVFPHIETWWTTRGDLLLVATRKPLVHDVELLRERMSREPFRTAIHLAWRVESIEGLFGHFVASDLVAATIAKGAELNTDDRTIIEYSFARALSGGSFSTISLMQAAQRLKGDRPAHLRGAINWGLVEVNRSAFIASDNKRSAFAQAYEQNNYARAFEIWRREPWSPANSHELMTFAFVFADAGDARAEQYASALRYFQPLEADAVLARLRLRQKRNREGADLLLRAYTGYRTNPWPMPSIMRNSLQTAMMLADDPAAAPIAFEALSKPFAAGQWEDGRQIVSLGVAEKVDRCGPAMMKALLGLEPHVPWRRRTLQLRAVCYASAGHPLAHEARRDFERFLREEPPSLLKGSL